MPLAFLRRCEVARDGSTKLTDTQKHGDTNVYRANRHVCSSLCEETPKTNFPATIPKHTTHEGDVELFIYSVAPVM